MSLENPYTVDQSGGNSLLASTPPSESCRSTAEGLPANQTLSQITINQPRSSNPSTKNSQLEILREDGLCRRPGNSVEEEQHDGATSTPTDSGGSSPSHTIKVGNRRPDTAAEVASVDTGFSESTIVPRRNLGYVQITSLMLNGTIGSGVFVTPGYVLLSTRSKPIALILWALGGVYTALR